MKGEKNNLKCATRENSFHNKIAINFFLHKTIPYFKKAVVSPIQPARNSFECRCRLAKLLLQSLVTFKGNKAKITK